MLTKIPYDEVYIFTLWYYPSHFGLHIDDIASAFQRLGIKTHIITVEQGTYKSSYFDSVRHMFIDQDSSSKQDIMRLRVQDFTPRAMLAPMIKLDNVEKLQKRINYGGKTKKIMVFHFFETFVPYFNKSTLPNISTCCVHYAGNFISRIAKLSNLELNQSLEKLIIDANLSHLYNDEEKLTGVDYIISETKSLVSMFNETKKTIPCFSFYRPFDLSLIATSTKIDIKKQFGLEKNAVILVYAGRPTKNTEVLLKIFYKIKQKYSLPTYLLLIGTQNYDITSWKYYKKIKKHLVTIDFLPRGSLFSYIKGCNVLLYPGLVDGHPKIISECQTMGVPVVSFSSNASGSNEIIEDGVTGILVPEGNIDKFVEKTLDLLKNKSLYNNIQKKSIEYIKQTFTDSNFAKMFTKLSKIDCKKI